MANKRSLKGVKAEIVLRDKDGTIMEIYRIDVNNFDALGNWFRRMSRFYKRVFANS